METIFTDRATIIIRLMFSNPDKKWVSRDFGEYGVSRGRAAQILKELRKKGYVTGPDRGRKSYNMLINRKELIEEWVKFYRFELSTIHPYYSVDENILNKIKKYFDKRKITKEYVLTLHTGANLITNYVNTEKIYCYVSQNVFDNYFLDMRQRLNLKELKRGGNVYIIKPYYKTSVFFKPQILKEYQVVSNLQLYLDLYNFSRRGKEHAQYLKKIVKEKDLNFA